MIVVVVCHSCRQGGRDDCDRRVARFGRCVRERGEGEEREAYGEFHGHEEDSWI